MSRELKEAIIVNLLIVGAVICETPERKGAAIYFGVLAALVASRIVNRILDRP